MNADGNGLTSLINSVPVDNLAWSPDGSKIVIANGEIETLNADGSGLTIVNNEYGDYNAIWSQDGKRIFFYSIGRTLNDRGFFMINADGSGKTLLNNKSMVVTDTFTLSPDDTKIAFTNSVTYNSNVNSNTWSCPEVFVSNLDGTGSTRLTFNPRVCGPQLINQVGNSNPVWSPDGKKIAFISSGRFADIGGLGDPYDRISVINADGTGQSYLTYDTDTLSWNPVWSPDSTKIAYISNKDGPDNIYVMNADGTDQTRLTNVNNDLYLAWG